MSIDERLGLKDQQITHMRRKRVVDTSRGHVLYLNPNKTFTTPGGDTITIRLYLEDGKGSVTAHHRVKIVWTNSRDGGIQLHSMGEMVKKLKGRTKPQRAKEILLKAGIEVN